MNRLEEEHGDYKTVAHIGPDRTVTIYDEEMPQAVRDEIKRIADTSEMTISATQDAPVFAVPPRVQEPPQKEEAPDPYPTLAAQVLRLIGEFDGSRMDYGEDDAQAVEKYCPAAPRPRTAGGNSMSCCALSSTMPTRRKKSRWMWPSAWSRSRRCPPALTPEQALREEIKTYLG